MDNLTSRQRLVNKLFKNASDWRTEAEYAALSVFKGDLLEDAYKRISAQFHEKLHRAKLMVLLS